MITTRRSIPAATCGSHRPPRPRCVSRRASPSPSPLPCSYDANRADSGRVQDHIGSVLPSEDTACAVGLQARRSGGSRAAPVPLLPRVRRHQPRPPHHALQLHWWVPHAASPCVEGLRCLPALCARPQLATLCNIDLTRTCPTEGNRTSQSIACSFGRPLPVHRRLGDARAPLVPEQVEVRLGPKRRRSAGLRGLPRRLQGASRTVVRSCAFHH